jgi:hypothetical protein
MPRTATLAYLAFVVILGFEAVVASLILSPRVPDRYRNYYIERSTDCWPVPVRGGYRLGETVSFLPGGPGADYTACGWDVATSEGTWSLGPEARLAFRTGPAPAGGLVLEIDMFGFVTASLKEQRVRITAGDRAVADVAIRDGTPGHQVISIPAAAVGADGWLRLTFNFPDAASPASEGLGNDRRRLGVRIVSLTLHAPAGSGQPDPAPPVPAGQSGIKAAS